MSNPSQSWYFFAFITLSRALREWRHAAVLKSASRFSKGVAENHARLRLLTGCMKGWRERAAALKAKSERAQSVGGHMALHKLSGAMLGWHALVVFVQSNRRAACLVLAALSQSLVKDAARNGIRAWKVFKR